MTTVIFITLTIYFLKNLFKSIPINQWIVILILFCAGFDLIVIVLKNIIIQKNIIFRPDFEEWSGLMHVRTITSHLMWHPHYILPLTLTLQLSLFVSSIHHRSFSEILIFCILIISLIGFSYPIALIWLIALLVYSFRRLIQKDLEYARIAIKTMLFLIICIIPFAIQFLKVLSLQPEQKININSVQLTMPFFSAVWSGAITSKFISENVITLLIDTCIHYFLEFGILIILSIIALLDMIEKKLLNSATKFLIIYGIISILSATFIESHSATFAIYGINPFRIMLFVFSVYYMAVIFINKKIYFRFILFLLLTIQALPSVGTLLIDSFFRFIPSNQLLLKAKKNFDILQLANFMDRLSDSDYRLEMFPVANNFSYYSPTSVISSLSDHAVPLFIGPPALNNIDLITLQNYVIRLGLIYNIDSNIIKQKIQNFDVKNSAYKADVIYYFAKEIQGLFKHSSCINADKLTEFCETDKLNYLVFDNKHNNNYSKLLEFSRMVLVKNDQKFSVYKFIY